MNNSTGIISTIAGTDSAGFNGDNILATTAKLNKPKGLAVDTSGNLYFTDAGNNRICKIDFITGIITTITLFVQFHSSLLSLNTVFPIFSFSFHKKTPQKFFV